MRTTGRRKVWVAATVVVATIALGPAPAGAKPRVDSFDGSCSLQGTVNFSPPATNTQQSLDVAYDATGNCSGTLDGTSVSNAPVTAYNAARNVDGSCLRADTTEPGRGYLEFADGTTIGFTSEFHFVGADGVFELQGQRSGTAHGIGNFLTQRTPPDIAMQCAGSGVPEAPLDVYVATESPLTSGPAGRASKSG